MVSVDEALQIILENVKRLSEVEIDCRDAFGFVLAEDIISDVDIPPFNKSAVDGYALRSQDIKKGHTIFKVSGYLSAGDLPLRGLVEGECVKIMTGAPLPEYADAVVMVEESEVLPDGRVCFKGDVLPGQNVCRIGEDIARGEIVLKRGDFLQAPEIAVLCALGRCRIRVVRKPSVAVLSTGSEVVEPDIIPERGKIRNSNGPMLIALLRTEGFASSYLGIAGDSEEELCERIAAGIKNDVLMISGGVSAGDYDLVPTLLERAGAEIIFHRVRVKPGKPLLFARKGNCIIFGLPGNPVSNLTSFFYFVFPALKKMMGMDDYRHELIRAVLTSKIKQKGDRASIMPSRFRIEDGNYLVTPMELNGSGDIAGCCGCNCFIILEEGIRFVNRGASVSILPLGS